MSGKVFGIGLSKTGTSSLSAALRLLGMRVAHFPKFRAEVCAADYSFENWREYDALTDAPVAAMFPHLDNAFPGSRFILTVRPVEDWLRSCERYYRIKDAERAAAGTLDRARFWRLLVFGCHEFSAERYRYVYERHLREVRHHFRDRQADYLELDISARSGWAPLCGFLGAPVPDAPFPHLNRTSDLMRQAHGSTAV